ncbi:MAG: type IV toxin-antitoxin system AbiEi family antitoxin [Pseudomonadota bacterium]|nr:type IV toxin-antitoxin system AbiEi family antitoxin [Pseudomonadota bacterium]
MVQAEQQLSEIFSPLTLQVRRKTMEVPGVDLAMEVSGGTSRWMMVCEIKSNGQPRHIRGAALQARDLARRVHVEGPTYPVVIAPFISAESGAICQELGVGYVDLAGNCRLVFDTLYVQRTVAKNPFGEKREQRSLFAPKSARILRLMLELPSHEWKVAELAERAEVSYGQVSKVRTYLIDREWAAGTWGAVRLVKPKALLDSWQKAYKPMRSKRTTYYTLLHGEQLQEAIKKATSYILFGQALLSSYSAARWLAPYARVAGEYFYVDIAGERRLKEILKLEPVAKGENVTIDLASDAGFFHGRTEGAPGIFCTSPIQTYLDLTTSGERGEEAAQHLFTERIEPTWTLTA